MQPHLSALESDALSEVFNIGMGRAADILSKMAEEEVLVSIPTLEILQGQEIIEAMQRDLDMVISSIGQSFMGDFTGTAMLVFPKDQSLNLIQSLIKTDLPFEVLGDIEEDALKEIGNIVLNACFGTVINMFKLNVEVSTPSVNTEQDLMEKIHADTWCLYMQIEFSLPNKKIQGNVTFIMDLVSINTFMKGLKNFIKPIIIH